MIPDIIRKARRLLGYTRTSRRQLLAGVFLSSVEHLISTWMIADLLGNCVAAIERKDLSMLWRAALFALPWLASLIALNVLAVYFTGIASARSAAAMRSHLLDVLLKTSLRNSLSSHSGVKLSSFTNDVNASFDSLIAVLTAPVSSLVVGFVCLIYVARVHWALAAIALAIGLLTYLYSVFFAKRLHAIAQKMQALMAVLESRMKDLLDGMVVSRIYRMRERLEGGMAEASNTLRREGVLWARVSGLLGASNNAASHFAQRSLVFAAGLFLLSDLLSLPDLMRVSEMAGGVIGVFHVSRMLVAVQRSLAGGQRVFDMIDGAGPEPGGLITEPKAPPEPRPREPGTRESAAVVAAAGAANPVLSFSKVGFCYSPSQMVFEDLSFEAFPGEMLAIAGMSGSGKSTVLRLAQGLYLPDRGSVVFMGTPVNEWNPASLRALLSLVPQEPTLFPGTIAANIAIGDKRIDMGRVREAAARAFIHDFIVSLPAGYDTQVAERGSSLSGGQRQRIAIARALYRDAPTLLLDEATSAMDAESETAVHKTLSRLKGKKTILYVTHREAAMRMADRVMMI